MSLKGPQTPIRAPVKRKLAEWREQRWMLSTMSSVAVNTNIIRSYLEDKSLQTSLHQRITDFNAFMKTPYALHRYSDVSPQEVLTIAELTMQDRLN